MIDMVSLLDAGIRDTENFIARAEVINEHKEKLYEEYLSVQEDYLTLEKACKDVEQLIKICKQFAVKFRDTRIIELEKCCESVIELAFPKEDFGVSLKADVFNNKEIATLLIGPKNVDKSKWFTPVSQNGGFVQQLIGSCMVAAICKMLKVDYIFFDEMFCSGDATSVADIKPFFEEFINNGVQLIIIEHKPTLYEGLDHREICLGKTRGSTDAVRIISNKIVKADLNTGGA